MLTAAIHSIPTPAMSLPPVEFGPAPPKPRFAGQQRQFKKHKVLPRPQADRAPDTAQRTPAEQPLILDTALRSAKPTPQAPGSRALKHHSKRLESGVELPPTPPIQSRTSSGSQSVLAPSPSQQDSDKSQDLSEPPERPVVTPPDQRSPPTPDVTPPQPANRPRALRPSLVNRAISRTTTGESRTDSFKTAREEPYSSGEDDDGRSTIRPALSSGRTSQATVRRVSDDKQARQQQQQQQQQRTSQAQALGNALSRVTVSTDGAQTPKAKGETGQFDGDFGSPIEVVQEWDDNLQRNVAVRKTSAGSKAQAGPSQRRDGPVAVEGNVISPSSATKAVRGLTLQDGPVIERALNGSSKRRATSSAPSNSDSSASREARPSTRDAVSKPNASTVLGAILVDTTPPPQRQRTLRHVRKQRALRESLDTSSVSTLPPTTSSQPSSRPPLKVLGSQERQRESFASTTTTNSIASGRARRDIWKSGAIPVVVVPDRRSSTTKMSREPSLRSTSSRRSKRTASIGSVTPRDSVDRHSIAGSSGPVFERPSRRSRRFSESDRDERTMDFPPAIPTRSSSLSAPTTRNNSRAGSMKAESVKSRSTLPKQATVPAPEVHLTSSSMDKVQTNETAPRLRAEAQNPAGSAPSGLSQHDLLHADAALLKRQYSHDKSDDGVSTKKYSSRNTPFSAASIETNGTAPELSEALAVHMYPHQNSSILMVNHSSKPSDGSDVTLKKIQEQAGDYVFTRPKITTTGPDGQGPVTPPQLQFSLDDIDSPLRNPRAPPEPPSGPPAIMFIPATPSGLTPADDKMATMGNYFESMKEKPGRRPSIVRRALNRRRRHSLEYPPTASKAPGMLTRTFSLTRNVRKVFDPATREPSRSDAEDDMYLPPEERPVEEHKLHPTWRPQSLGRDFDDFDYDGDDDVVYRYPPIDNRPSLPKRSLSERMKRTFAIFPIQDEAQPTETAHGPERRTIRRTDSGNLRVVQRRASADSSVRRRSLFSGQSTGPEAIVSKALGQGYTARRRVSKERYRRFSIGDTFEEIQSIPRRLSEKRREKRSRALREKISGPKEVRDGVEDMLRSNSGRERARRSNRI
jgi:hypothetical protein